MMSSGSEDENETRQTKMRATTSTSNGNIYALVLY